MYLLGIFYRDILGRYNIHFSIGDILGRNYTLIYYVGTIVLIYWVGTIVNQWSNSAVRFLINNVVWSIIRPSGFLFIRPSGFGHMYKLDHPGKANILCML